MMNTKPRAHPDLNQGPADLQSAALATELCTHEIGKGGQERWRLPGPRGVVGARLLALGGLDRPSVRELA